MKITVEIENGEVTAYKDCSKSVLFPDGRRVLFQKPLCELKNVPIDETGYIEHLKSIGFVEVAFGDEWMDKQGGENGTWLNAKKHMEGRDMKITGGE